MLTSALLGAAALAAASLAGQAQPVAGAEPAVAPAASAKTEADAGKPAAAPASAADKPVADKSGTAKAGKDAVVDASGTDEDENVDADGVVATVNDEIISDFEVRQRMALFLATSAINPTPEEKKRLRGQIIGQLEDEKVQMQEAVKQHITVSPTEVDKSVNTLLQENNISLAQLRATLEVAGSSLEAMRTQLTAQIAWRKLVQDRFMASVMVTPAAIDAELASIKEGANKPHYLVGEIFMPVDSPDQEAKVKKAIEDASKQLQAGASFQGLARQLSQSPSAASGGDMGWIRDGQLAPELNTMLAKMPAGSVSPPVRGPGGWYILTLRSRQEPVGTDVTPIDPNPHYPEGSLPLARLLLPMAGADKTTIESAMKVANDIRAHVVSCQGMDKVAAQIKGSVYADLGVAKLGDLSQQIQEAIAKTQPGETAAPFMDEAGIEIIARCDKRPQIRTAFQIPSRDDVEQQLFEAQISALARRYKRDLKRDADIQVR
jgi:peptidyl-prolyl cis-trans isomerase SurA